jgi:hypothetical protein
MRNTLIGVASSVAMGAALLAGTTQAQAQTSGDNMFGPGPGYGQQPPPSGPQAPAPGYGAAQQPPPSNDIFVTGGSRMEHPAPVFGTAYGPNAAGPGELTQAGVCWLFPMWTSQGSWHLDEVCR